MPPRLVRRRPLADRLKSYLDPSDLLLWLVEEFESGGWDHWLRDWAISIGIFVNLICLIARANSAYKYGSDDDVFGNDRGIHYCRAWLATLIVHLLSLLSFANAMHVFLRKRHYRLFENPMSAIPSTPSAHRVQVDSSPMSSSPLRMLSSLIVPEKSRDRLPSSGTREVWEITVWNPTSFTLKLFCLFSPGHVLVYWLFLPSASEDPRPSVTIVRTIALAFLLSIQLYYLQSRFSQQSKDSSIIQREVLNEYDTKYVHPRTQPLMRDVGTQFPADELPPESQRCNEVDIYAPTFVINRGFRIRPNSNYVKYVDPEQTCLRRTPFKGASTSSTQPVRTPAPLRDMSSPMRPQTVIRQPQLRSNAGDGGSLGAFSHANSPYRRSGSDGLSRSSEHRSSFSPIKRDESPLKRSSHNGLSYDQRSSKPGGERR